MDANKDQDQYLDNAIRAVKEKKPLPEIDFTLHTMEDGTQVSTLDRVCKGTDAPKLYSCSSCYCASYALFAVQLQLTPRACQMSKRLPSTLPLRSNFCRRKTGRSPTSSSLSSISTERGV